MGNISEYAEPSSALRRAFHSLEKMQARLEQFAQAEPGLHLQAWKAVEEEKIQQANASEQLSADEIEARLIVLEKQWYTNKFREQVEGFSPLKRALLLLERMQTQLEQMKNEQHGSYPRRLPPLQPVSRDHELPLSFAQQRLWFLYQIESKKTLYNEYGALRLEGLLDGSALEQSLQTIVHRHECLRTVFPQVDGHAYQRILPWQPLKIAWTDLQNVSPSLREAEAIHVAEAELEQPLDLASGPLFKVRLFRLAEDEHLLLIVFHHIIGDGWSLGVLYQELALLYSAYRRGMPAPLGDLSIQYADFSAWQQRWLQGDVLEKQMAYWVKHLEGATPVLNLPTDYPRPALPTNRGALYSFPLPVPLVLALRELSQREGVTLFMILLAAFQTLLYRYTGQEDVLVGTTTANRTSAALESLIGFFANTLVMRGDLSGNPPFRELLRRVRATALSSYEHQDIPFEQLVASLHLQRDLSRSPLVQVMFVLQKASWVEAALDELRVSALELERGRATFDLVLSVVESAQGLHASLEYSTDLFEEVTIARLAGHWQTMLEQVVRQPDLRLRELALLTQAERQQLLVDWNLTSADHASSACIHELVEAQVRQTPRAIALICQGRQFTYEYLNQRANQLAHYLRTLGVGPDVLVGITMDRSPETIIGILGVLKAGGAYIPLDPAYPAERLAYILKDAQAPVLLTQRRLANPGMLLSARIVYLESDWTEIAGQSTGNPARVTTGQNLAYAIYTSGSTGQPKGVLLEHAGLCNLVQTQIRHFALGSESRVLQLVSFSFDVSVADIFMALCSGAMLCLVPQEEVVPGPALLTLLREHGVTLAHIPPAILAVLPAEELPSLKVLIVGGESWSSDIVARWGAGRRFINEYGPTETTICATMAECLAGQRLSIGRPLANVRVYVLDPGGMPVPVGMAGELSIGGSGLARGYLGRADLTAEAFLPDPFGRGDRLYKTGDLVRWQADGTLEFLGRRDQQVKVRGYRIELGEIEAALARQPGVRENIVLMREDRPGDKKLVAYVVPRGPATPSISELRRSLKEHIPEYMVPAAFVLLDKLPLTANDKVDRHALPAPEPVRPELDEKYVVPGTTVEQSIAAVWKEILGVERVGVQDNFFELGGHSLSLVRVHRRLQESLKADLTLVDLFQYPTIRALANFMTGEQKTAPVAQHANLSEPDGQINVNSPEIAIVGMAGRFPGARNVDEFWKNLQQGVESVSFFTREELLASGVDPALLKHPLYVPAGAVLEDIEWFDASFFGYSPREAEVIDPQQRLFLECAWQALEHAGYDSEAYSGSVAVYAGASMNTYLAANLQNNPILADSVSNYHLVMSNSADFLATRVSYKLNLRGPSVTVQTACSTSLVAVHMACESLRMGKCDMALAGGVSVRLPQKAGYVYQEEGIMSPDGHCRAFDTKAQGFVGGEGVGIVVLKRLADALADGDTIHAVIKGSAINNDGSAKVGYTAPGVQGQADVIKEGLSMAGITPETVSYIETHGTGTSLGDPIEVSALRQVYATHACTGTCALGSVKTNIGHLDAAAGIAGLLKTVQALKHQLLPPTLHFAEPHPALDLEHSPFYINATLAPWTRGETPRRAGVSSFGIGGTNAHVVLEEAPLPEPAMLPSMPARPYHIIVLSARTETALRQARVDLVEYLRQHTDLNLADVAYTLQAGRRSFPYRLVAVCRNITDTVQVLSTSDPGRLLQERVDITGRPVAFLFPGQGTQYGGMARDLYEQEPGFRAEIDHCVELLIPYMGLDLRTVLFTAGEDADKQLKRTELAQPALFVVEYALARLWMTWGMQPSVMIGHSIGEYVAACLAGVFSLEAALQLVAVRGRLMQHLPEGAMLAVPLPEQEVRSLLGQHLSIAAINASAQCVISGPMEAIEALEQQLLAQKIGCRRLHTSHAFHSPMMDSIVEAFTNEVRAIDLRPPALRYISNISGVEITADQATDPHYWAQHLRQPVRFADGIQSILRESDYIFLEVGPGQALGSLVRQQLPREEWHRVIPSLRRIADQRSDSEFILVSLGRLWLAGATVMWQRLNDQERQQRIPLPTYPFERQRYWVERSPDIARWQSAFSEEYIEQEREEEVTRVDAKTTLYPRPNLPSAYVAPRNELEQKIANTWQQLLGIEEIGVYDNFFDLGGHSLLATQIVARLRSALQVDVSLRYLFETLTVAGLADLIAGQLSATQGQQSPRIVPVARDGHLPLSFAQQRFWLLEQLKPGEPMYNIPIAAHLHGQLDSEVLIKSLREIVRRHDSLRTGFHIVEKEPVQVIAPVFTLRMPIIHLQHLPAAEREAEMLRLKTDEALIAFDLAQGPLLRVTLLRLDEQHHVLLVIMHHIIADGWSMGIFFRELTALYTAFIAGQSAPLADLPVQYPDFAAWQAQYVKGAVLADQLSYWKEQLAGELPVLELPTDHPRPPVQTYTGGHQSILLPATLIEDLKKLSNNENVTLFMTLLAAFQALLSRYTGQTDILVGTPAAGRNDAEIENVIGNFTGSLVLRTNLAGNPSFRELLERVRRVTLGAYAHQDLPFEQVVEALRPQYDKSRASVYQALLRLPNAPTAPFKMGNLEVHFTPIKTATANRDLTLDMVEMPDGFAADMEYDMSLFEASTISRLLGHWQTLLEAVAANPHLRLQELPLLTPAERQQLLAWNASDQAGTHICDVFEAQARRTPQKIAITSEQQLSYAELNKRANQVAHHLRGMGVGPEVMVGVSVEPSIEGIVALLGILKAGGAYVPLDPTYPADRLSFMVDDCSPSLLLTQERVREKLPVQFPCPTLSLDVDWPAMAQERVENPSRAGDIHHLAYVIYTSGSTGRPKGVLVSHAGLSNLVEEQRKAFAIETSDTILQFASLNFDASVSEIFTALCTGATLCLGSVDELKPGRTLIDLLRKQEITLVTLPPSALAVLPVEELSGVGKMVVAGEACPAEVAQRWARGRRLINAYGPTESTVCATFSLCEENETKAPSLGRPIGGVQVYVLDAQMQPVPIGVPGELHIEGIGLARGYLHQAALTAEKFVPHPFGSKPGGRLYKTGDLARYRPDGSLEFLGRIDQQVKIRGFRVELGEIEAVLGQHPALRTCAVVVREDVPGDQRLIAYVVVAPQVSLAVSDLRTYLKEHLPEYMLPGVIILLDALPLLPNGKVDRQGLPSPRLLATGADEDYIAPRSPVEELLAAAFAKLLGVERVGIHDNFFELGGHSLLATQLVSQLQESFQVDLPLHILFEATTVAELAVHLEHFLQDKHNTQMPPIVPIEHQGNLPLSFAQQRLWFLDQLQPDSAFYNVSALFRLRGVLDTAILERSLQEIVRRHEILRTTFILERDLPVQVIAAEPSLKLTITSINAMAGAERENEVRRLVREEVLRPFDLARGPLIRAMLLPLGMDEHILLLVVHNIVADGWSREILIHELVTIYEAFSNGKPSPLPELAIQYADFAAWQRQWLRDEIMERHLAFWKRQLAGAPTVLELPTDRPRSAAPTYRGGHHTFSFPIPLIEGLRDLSQRESVTMFMTLLASFQVLISRYSGQEDIVIGSPIANRNRADLERLIGFFVNTLVLRTDLSGDPSFRELLVRVRKVALEAYAHQDLPFEKLVEALQPERHLNHSPLFQVMFTLQSIPARVEKSGWLSTESLEVETQIAKFDMSVSLIDHGRELSGVLEFNSDLFEAATITRFVRHWQTLLDSIVAHPDTQISLLPLLDETEPRDLLTRRHKQPLAIAATFTAEPLEEALTFWLQELDQPLRVVFAPYHQLFQQLLDPDSLLSRNQQGVNVLLIRFEDWLRGEHGVKTVLWPGDDEKIERILRDLVRALRVISQRIATPFLLCVCPSTPAILADAGQQIFCKKMEDFLVAEVQKLKNIYIVAPTELATTYPVTTSYDPVGDELGHVPYTPEFFAALATLLARKIFTLRRSPYKVIVVDCDNTLWKGTCGEDGAMGIELDAPRLMLQKFLVAQQEAGILLCLCSKNYEKDVFDVFARHPEMPLQREHLVSWRINWQAKSTNLAELARELQLGLDSFIFIDDNPLECAEVQASYPMVLTLPLPQNLDGLPNLLAHIWAFDHLQLTEEDRYRTLRYQENASRVRLQQEALSLEEFLAGLDLEVQIEAMEEKQLTRVVQLFQRTNQFNSTTLRLTEAELQLLLQRGEHECLVVEVRDRFGAYGLVGVMLFAERAGKLIVDSFLLSCRALGKGVEHQMLRRLGTIASERGLSHVSLPYLPTARNTPVFDFLEQIGSVFKRSEPNEGWVFDFPVEQITEIVYKPTHVSGEAEAREEEHGTEPAWLAATSSPSRQLLKIANELATPEQVLKVLAERKGQHSAYTTPLIEARTETERTLAGLYAELLHLDQVGINDNFFTLGGHSLLATQLLSRVATALRVKLPLSSIFEAPTIALLAERITAMRQEVEHEHAVPPLVPVPRNQELPLSFAQQRLWFLNQFTPDNVSYNIPLQMRLQGVLDVEIVKRSLNEIISRHEALRTTFPSNEGRAMQMISPSLRLSLPIIDLRCLEPVEREARALYLAVEESQQIFHLAHGPLIRARLLRLDDEEYILLVTVHHIIFDAWSAGVLSREFIALYEALRAGKSSPLAALPVQYADFAVWQRAWLQGDVLDEQIAYWRRQLSGAPPLDLPTDRPRTALRGSRGAVQSFTFPVHLMQALATLSRQEGATLFMTMLTAFQTLLHRYTGQEDIVVGTDIANRTREETEALIGFFVNLLALRINLDGALSFREVLRRVRAMVLGAYAHQDLPFEKLIDALHLERNANWTPLVRALFVFQNVSLPSFEIQGLTLSPVEIEMGTTNFDLAWFMWESPQGLVGRVNYSSDLFDAATIATIIHRFEVLLENIIAHPESPLDTLEISTATEQETRLKQEAAHREMHRRRLKTIKRDELHLPDVRSL